MSYNLTALIAKNIPPALTGGITPVALTAELQLLPFTDQWYKNVVEPLAIGETTTLGTDLGLDGLTDDLVGLIARAAADTGTVIAFVAADYFGGAGDQTAAVWGPDGLVVGPLTSESGPHSRPINDALRSLGVHAADDQDEFDTVGLGRHRNNEDWMPSPPQFADLDVTLVDFPGLAEQMNFLTEATRLADVIRQAHLPFSHRRENTAEHSWHVALCAVVLAEYAPEGCDIARAVTMLVTHDLVECYAGDTDAHDHAAVADAIGSETAAADRLFALLPPGQSTDLRAMWDEFEAKESADARFAAAIDRFQPLLFNIATNGVSWQRRGITPDQVRAVNARIADGAPVLHAAAEVLVVAAETAGMFDR